MAPDGSGGATQGGEGNPNIDSVKKTIATYYGDPGTGISNKVSSPYISEISKLVKKVTPAVLAQCRVESRFHSKAAVVFDADDTTLWTTWRSRISTAISNPPSRTSGSSNNDSRPHRRWSRSSKVANAGCTVIGLTGRNDVQKSATLGNLAKVGYQPFTGENYFTKWTGVGASQQPSYITCAAAKCTTIEYKSQTRKYVESRAFGRYDIIANFGDQFSDLIGGHADRAIKLPNPTYYLP
jgi:hypothetical protein